MHYFAYASNLDPELLRAEHRVLYRSRVRADLPGFRLAFNKPDPAHPGAGRANLVGDPRETVQGALYELNETDFERLDEAEGVRDGRYFRATLLVRRAADGTLVEAQVYVGTSRGVRGVLRPTKRYLDRILAGRDLLDTEYVDRLATLPVWTS
jgi:gamma-glutamylcyclotransferase (GGCT)/AIG2-like uncharacterized protein YtfP